MYLREDETRAGLLRARALASLRSAATAFNGMHDDGRTCQVLRDLQHASRCC